MGLGLLLTPLLVHADALDQWHSAVSCHVGDLVEWMDRFFGDEQVEEDTRPTHVRVGLGVEWDRTAGPSLVHRTKVRLALPRLENRLQLLAEGLTRVDDPEDLDHLREAVRDTRPDLGLRFWLRDDAMLRLSADAGLQLGSEPQVFGRLRSRQFHETGPWEYGLLETLQWYSENGLEAALEARLTRRLGPCTMVRSSSRLAWDRERDGVTLSQMFSWSHVQSDTTGHRVFVYAEWPEVPVGGLRLYEVGYVYRRNFLRPWMFWEIAPALNFAEARDFEPNPKVSVLLEVFFTAPIRPP
jgi:hypothetical protein